MVYCSFSFQLQSNCLNELTEVGYIISRSVSVIDNFGRLIEFGRLIAQPYNEDIFQTKISG